jgi:hypothetical protein
MARAPVSKTGGCRFESCHSCHILGAFGSNGTRTTSLLDPSWTQPSLRHCATINTDLI